MLFALLLTCTTLPYPPAQTAAPDKPAAQRVVSTQELKARQAPASSDPAYTLRQAHGATAPAPAKGPRPAAGRPTLTIATGHCDAPATYHLPAQRFDETAQAIAHASGCFVQYQPGALAATPVKAVRGRLSQRQALRMALAGTPLHIVQETPDLLRVELAR